MTQYSEPPSSISAARFGVIRVWTMRQSDRAAFASSVSTSVTPTQSLIMCRGMRPN